MAVVALVAACAALAAGCGTSTGSPNPPPADFYGIVPNVAPTAPDVAQMKRAGVGSLRIRVFRPSVEPTPGAPYNWAPVDQIVAEASEAGIDVLATISGTPAYQHVGCTESTCPAQIELSTHAERAGWHRFFGAAVQRYGPRGSFWSEHPSVPERPITRWEIWNEPNNPIYKDPPRTYAKLLGIASNAIKAADANAEVILGGMFGTPKGGASATAWRYLADLYAAGAGSNFDAVALHPYAPNVAGITYQMGRIRSVLASHDDASKPTFITEIGWGSGGSERSPGTGGRGQVFVVSPQRQARNLTRSFALLTNHRSSWRVGGVYWFTWRDPTDPPPGLCAFCYSSGLYEANGTTPKPALDAFERFTRRSAGA